MKDSINLISKINKLEDENEKLSLILAQQRATMYYNQKEIKRLRLRLDNHDHAYQRLWDGLKEFCTSNAKLIKLGEKEKRLYTKLILYGVSVSEISKIEKEYGFNGLREKRLEYINKKRVDMGKSPIKLKKK